MIKRILKFLLVVVMAFSVSVCINPVSFQKVHADSGWDSDYDSGGSDWGSDSDWSSDSSWDSDSSESGFVAGIVTILAFVVVFVVIVIVMATGKSSGGYSKPTTVIYNKLTDDQVHAIDPTLNITEFNKKVYDIYLNIQNAWSNFDYDSLRKYTTDEIYNMYSMQLNTLEAKGEKNIMKDFVLVDSHISNIYKNEDSETIESIVKVRFYDYVVDSTGKVLRGTSNQKLEITYKLTFVKSIEQNSNNFCPSCGAKLENTASTVCPFCKSVIVSDNHDWVMSKKQSLNQTRL